MEHNSPETGPKRDTVETGMGRNSVETGMGRNDVETAVERNDVETAVERNDVETAVERNDVETAVERNDVETAVERNDVENAVERNAIETALEQNAIENAVERNAIENAVERNAVETSMERNDVETALEQDVVVTAMERNSFRLAHAVLLERTNFQCVLEHIAPTDILSCLEVCKDWRSFILPCCTSETYISISSCSTAEAFKKMKAKIASFVSKYSKKAYNFKMTITSTLLHVDSPLFVQLVPNFASSLYRLQLSLKGAAFGGVYDEDLLRNLLVTLTSLVELEMDLPIYACRFAGRACDIRSAFDVILTPPFAMPTLRKLIWREPLYLHKTDYLPVAFPSLSVCVVSLVAISPYLGSTTIDRGRFVPRFPNPPYSTMEDPLSISWPSLNKLTVEGYDDLDSQFEWMHNISEKTQITDLSLLNVAFKDTVTERFILQRFFLIHADHITNLKLTRSRRIDPYEHIRRRDRTQELLEKCPFPSLHTLDCDVTFFGNIPTAIYKMPLLQKIYLSTFSLRPVQPDPEHDVSKSCDNCKYLWRQVFPIRNGVKHLVLRGNHCTKNINSFAVVFDKLECLEVEEYPGYVEIVRKAFRFYTKLNIVSYPPPPPEPAQPYY